MGLLGVLLLVVHPVPVTVVTVGLSVTALSRLRRGWAFGLIFVLMLAAFYGFDATHSWPRVAYARSLSTSPEVLTATPLPPHLVIVGQDWRGCGEACHARLFSGELDEVILVIDAPRSSEPSPGRRAFRYAPAWATLGTCPVERRRAFMGLRGAAALRREGFCPRLDPVDVPTEGVFLVTEFNIRAHRERAALFVPHDLAERPPGPLIRFSGVEVQRRTGSKITILARAYGYFAPGFLGLPPLIGCWERPDNIVWITPAGDTGCGFWRRLTGGGVLDESIRVEWAFDRAFTPPGRSITPPRRPNLPSPTFAQAAALLAGGDVANLLPVVTPVLLAPEVSDEALAELAIGLNRGGELEGALLALLIEHRPAAARAAMAEASRLTWNVRDPGAVLDRLDADPRARADLGDAILDLLAAPGFGSERVAGRFLAVMARAEPGWLCARLDRVTGPTGLLRSIADWYKDTGAPRPPRAWGVTRGEAYLPLMAAAMDACGAPGAEVAREALRLFRGYPTRQMLTIIAARPAPMSALLADEVAASLLGVREADIHYLSARREDDRDAYARAHWALLTRAGWACEGELRRIRDEAPPILAAAVRRAYNATCAARSTLQPR